MENLLRESHWMRQGTMASTMMEANWTLEICFTTNTKSPMQIKKSQKSNSLENHKFSVHTSMIYCHQIRFVPMLKKPVLWWSSWSIPGKASLIWEGLLWTHECAALSEMHWESSSVWLTEHQSWAWSWALPKSRDFLLGTWKKNVLITSTN